jgi:hypothetical protein
MRRSAALLLTVLAGAGMFGALPASPAAAKNSALELLLPVVPSMLPGQQGWVGTTWIATDDICDVQVTAGGTGFTVAYPSNTATYSSLYQNSSALAGGIDFTAFHLTVSPKAAGTLTLNLTMSYRVVPNGHAGDATWCKSASRTTDTASVTMAVKSYTGPAFVQATTTLTASRTAPAWAKLGFTGYLPGQSAFGVALTPPSGLAVKYPNDASAAALNSGSTLPVGYEDFASVYLDATGLKAGVYTIPLTITSALGTTTSSLTLTVG